MKLLVALCLLAVVAAAPPSRVVNYPTGEAQILKYEFDNFSHGGYKYAYEQTDGTRAEQTGQIRKEGTKEESLAVSGSFQWVGPNGVTYTVTYTADEEGYKPEVEEGPGALPAHVIATQLG